MPRVNLIKMIPIGSGGMTPWFKDYLIRAGLMEIVE